MQPHSWFQFLWLIGLLLGLTLGWVLKNYSCDLNHSIFAMLDIVCFVLGKWLLDRKSKESEMYDEHKHVLKTATSGNASNPHSPFFGLEFHVNTTYAYRWKVAPYVATFRVLGKKKILHIPPYPGKYMHQLLSSHILQQWSKSNYRNSSPFSRCVNWLSMNSLASFM